MNKRIKITNQQALTAFTYATDGLHDALLREVVVCSPGFVDHQGQMVNETKALDAKLFFQSQFKEAPAILVELRGVSEFRFDSRLELQLDAECGEGGVALYLSGRQFANRSFIRAEGMEYEILGVDYLGSQYRFVPKE